MSCAERQMRMEDDGYEWRKRDEYGMIMAETAVTGSLLIANAVRDIRKREILLLPTILVLTGGVIRGAVSAGPEMWECLPSLFSSLLPGGVLLLLSVASSGKIGFGDGLTVCAAGIWCGPGSILLSLFLALLMVPAAAGVLWAASGVRHRQKKPSGEFPFIPFLLAGFILSQILLEGAGF